MEVRNHHSPWWCDSSPDGQGKESRAKKGAMNDIHISQRHGNRLGMLGETAQPICHHTPHDRSCINPFHLRKELERCTYTPTQGWKGGSSQPLLLPPPQLFHLAVRCANVTMQRLLSQPLQPDDIPALWLWTCEQHFLGEAFKASPAAQSYLLSTLMFWHEPNLCTQLAPFSHDAFRVIIPCFPRVLV